MKISNEYIFFFIPLWPWPSIWLARDPPFSRGSSRRAKATPVLVPRASCVPLYLNLLKISIALLHPVSPRIWDRPAGNQSERYSRISSHPTASEEENLSESAIFVGFFFFFLQTIEEEQKRY